LQLSISQTKAKQMELEVQRAALVKKQEELDNIKLNLAKSQGQQRNQGEAASDGAVVAKLSELENLKRALQQKEQELNKTRDLLSVQQAGIDAKGREVRTRKIEAPEETKKQITIIPAF
jgi:hypothetical protein